MAAALAEHARAKVWGVEPSPEMLAVARARLPRTVGVRSGRAENLPFRAAWFDGVVYSLVVHLVDRPRAFAEAERVLAPGGRVVVATFAHQHFETYWAARYFPSIAEIDRGRFPTESQLVEGLAEAGFSDVTREQLSSHRSITRKHALDRIHGRNISTFALLDANELREGILRAERELPAMVDVHLEQLVVAAIRL
jgi:ubiquinone/menaquinone biosynthesis C-methylase UbiE